MAWPRVDYHTHICESTVDAMLASAVEKGVREYGISEHIFMLHEGQPIFPLIPEEGIPFSRAQYVDTCRERSRMSKISIRLGLEVDYVPGTEARVADVLAGVEWDYLIGSIHEIDGIDLFEHPPADADEGKRLWRRYYELSIAAIESSAFDVLSHPVRNMVRNPYVPEDIDDLLSVLAESAARNGVALELNGEDTRRWPKMVTALAKASGGAGCAVSLGSDAHKPESVAQSLQAASLIAAEAGVPGVVSFQRRDRRILAFD
ncbi:MAG TPA: PHP domain-containing protein [Thermomicrobiales bacterium]|nr:PHP domain-containing protein [Thermomicrobiales bacterium]